MRRSASACVRIGSKGGLTDVKAIRVSRSIALDKEVSNMAIVVEFNIPDMTAAEYDGVLEGA